MSDESDSEIISDESTNSNSGDSNSSESSNSSINYDFNNSDEESENSYNPYNPDGSFNGSPNREEMVGNLVEEIELEPDPKFANVDSFSMPPRVPENPPNAPHKPIAVPLVKKSHRRSKAQRRLDFRAKLDEKTRKADRERFKELADKDLTEDELKIFIRNLKAHLRHQKITEEKEMVKFLGKRLNGRCLESFNNHTEPLMVSSTNCWSG